MELKGLSIGYKKAVVSDINQELRPGSFVCLLGRNGTGKSTLLKTLAGLIPAVKGEIIIDDKPLNEYTPIQIATKIGLVLTQMPDLPNTTLRELVAYGRLPYVSWLGKINDSDWLEADRAIQKLGIETLDNRHICELSDGERQKSMIARALAQGTEYLLLDEPSAFLDYESKQELMSLLVHLAHEEHKAILLSTHDQELAMQSADFIWRIKNSCLNQEFIL